MLNAVLRDTAYTSPTTVYLALLDSGTEVSGGSYARQAITFGAPSSGQVANSAAITFSNMPATTVNQVAIYDAATAGDELYSGSVTTAQTFTAGDSATVAVGAITVSES